MHKGTYADDCLVSRVTQHKAFIVATCDKDLKRRIRKVCTYSIFVGLFRNGVSVEIVLRISLFRCRGCLSCSSPTTDMWLKECQMPMEPPRAVNKIAPPLYLKSIRNIFEIFLFNMFFTTVSSRLNLAEVKWLKSTAPRNRGVVEPMPFSKLLVRILVQGVCYIWPPRSSLQGEKK